MINYDMNFIKRKLYSNSLDIFELIGLYGMILFSKELFRKNSQVADFVNHTMNLNLANYIIKSRALITAKVIKTLINYDVKEQKYLHDKCIEYFNKLEKVDNVQEIKRTDTKKKKSENEKLSIWLKGLKNDK